MSRDVSPTVLQSSSVIRPRRIKLSENAAFNSLKSSQQIIFGSFIKSFIVNTRLFFLPCRLSAITVDYLGPTAELRGEALLQFTSYKLRFP